MSLDGEQWWGLVLHVFCRIHPEYWEYCLRYKLDPYQYIWLYV